jgi:Uri superfamily endonuclease
LHQKQQKTMSDTQFTIFGNKCRMGSYILFVRISSPFQLSFGRFQQGKLFTIPESDYIYIGSALGGGKSGNPLARRLIRHASRSAEKPPHEIRAALKQFFSKDDVTINRTIEPLTKKLHWHIDYLLDRPEAEIIHIVIIRGPMKMEQKLSELLESLQETSLLAPRLGAQDARNSTHLLRITDRKRILELLWKNIPILTAQSELQ